MASVISFFPKYISLPFMLTGEASVKSVKITNNEKYQFCMYIPFFKHGLKRREGVVQ
jgi:hypothetical protein